MKKQLNFLAYLFGFEKLSRYERDYLHDVNRQSCVYLGFIAVVLEVWMLIRQTITKIIPKYQQGGDLFSLVVRNTSKFWLFLLFGLGLMLFCAFCQRDKKFTKTRFVSLLAVGLTCILYTSVLGLESFVNVSDTVTPVMAGIVNGLTIALYITLFLFGTEITIYAFFRYRKNKSIVFLEHLTIHLFAIINLLFGILVSYTDYWGGKEITCFFVMMIYVGCMLIYRPYITFLILGTSFWVFYRVLLTYQNGGSFQAKEVVISGVTHNVISGDTTNYITFFISLAAVCFTMYHSRLKEARKTYNLQMATAELEKKNKEMHEQFIQTTEALASAIDAKDPYTNGHSRRVAAYSLKIAETVGKSEEDCEKVYFAALLHDVGKIGVSNSIINKKGRLTDKEFEQIKRHPVLGGQILSVIKQSPWLSIGARYHHERYGGNGYPEGLKGEDIPEIARIIAVADAYDAMTSNRSYRNAIPQQIVREEIVKGMGKQFDAEFAKVMIHMIDMDTEYLMREVGSAENLTPKNSLRCDSLYHDCTEGIILTKRPVQISFCSQPDEGIPEDECLPSLIVFDALDGRVHPGEENNQNLLYFEYAQIRFDGHVTERNTRKTEVSVVNQENDLETAAFGEPERERRYKAEAVRYRDRALIRISDEKRTLQIILALPDTSRFVYIAIGGEHCHIHNIRTENVGAEIEPDFIPCIAEEISYIKDCPEGDIPNVEVDGWCTDTSAGIPIKDGMTLSFHTMSMPTARLVWHCPFISVFSSDNGQVSGENFREYMLLRLDGENWESDAHAENIVQIKQQADFAGWDEWKAENKKGLDCVVKIERKRNMITMETENLGITVRSTTAILDDVEDVYVALTGDQCAITNIHVLR